MLGSAFDVLFSAFFQAAAGIEPTDLIPMGKLLIVTEGSSDAREEEVILAPCWTGKAVQCVSLRPNLGMTDQPNDVLPPPWHSQD